MTPLAGETWGPFASPVTNGSRRLPAERATRQAGRRYQDFWARCAPAPRGGLVERALRLGDQPPATAHRGPTPEAGRRRAAVRKEDVPEMRLARPSLTLLVALLAGLALAGCASSATAGWTFAPPPPATPTPAASAGGSAAPTASGSAAPGSAAPGSPAASGGAADVSIMAMNIAFQPTSVTAPAGRPFTIDFNNMDASVPHDIYIKDFDRRRQVRGRDHHRPGRDDVQRPGAARRNVHVRVLDPLEHDRHDGRPVGTTGRLTR